MNIHDYFITLSGPSCSFQDHIYVSLELHHHQIKKCITSKVYHDTYKLHQNFLAFLNKTDVGMPKYHLRSINPNMINHYTNQSQTCQLLKILKTIFFSNKENVKSDAINFRLNWYRIYIYIYVEFLASHFKGWSLEIYRVGNNRRTVNTSTTPHISGQLGTKKSCKILLCWFIVMIWVLVCHNMYRYERHFGFFYRNPTI